ncbi:uncharacterized protein DUF3616 [Tamaricihabitans halophyticus]|uniref:Uncharacterized protein DUF3616 n=1 Tax=Tamaricihabitans halophyticus TaxID=1262583 RepID=A0A4R2R0K8_9PSEU|nr:DUF3616 domain-containing protein [Tamaricihabitans halophyticus]TCP56172.1 uncharacterized protein DUF3616 [Tamaricihabitans halophyticus]
MGIERTVRLRFAAHAVEADTHVNLSAIHTDGSLLWIAGDETATIERLTCDDPSAPAEYGQHVTFALDTLIRLPGAADEEVDVEGMAHTGDYLWVVGSHSAKRKKVKDEHDDEKSAKRLAAVSAEPARRVLARLAMDGDEPVAEASDGRRSAALGKHGLFGLLAEDEHFGPFLGIPGKDNGFDIEGIAVHGDAGAERVFLGMRGPVLRGWAAVLQLEPRVDGDELKLAKIADKRRYAKHFLDLGGLGIRDMCEYGEDLLILAGPTMDLDGPVRVFRWPGAAALSAPDVVRREDLHQVLEIPYGEGTDHAEGIALLPDDRLLVVYDSPASTRLPQPGTVLADVFALPR